MQLTSLLRTAATAAALSVLLLTTFQKAHAQGGTVIYNLCSVGVCTDGDQPIGSLVADGYGNLYGTTQLGGTGGGGCLIACQMGTVFELSPEPAGGCASGLSTGNGWCQQVLYSFCSNGYYPDCADGESPSTNLVVVAAGTPYNRTYNLYGTTYNGGYGSSCQDPNGYGCGIAFELSPEPLPTGFGCPSGTNLGNGWCEKVLYNFCSQANCADGPYPGSGLVRDSNGNFYGANSNGVFELYQNSGVWDAAIIYPVQMNYTGNLDFTTEGGVALDGKGNLYGADGNENIFKLSVDLIGQWVATNIHTFTGEPKDGNYPVGTPAVDSAGNVYGTTNTGGAAIINCPSGCGTVWRLTPVTTGTEAGTYKERILHSFTSPKTGYYPLAGVTLDSSGNIYGTTAYGGAYYTLAQCKDPNLGTGCGTVFKLAKTDLTYTYKLLWSFNGTDGAFPFANPFLDSSGHIYGTTYEGGTPYSGGTVFEVNPSGAATATTLTASPNPSISGEAITFTATVISGAGTPPDGDTVNLMKSSTVLGTGTLSGGVASFTTSSLPVGTSAVDAVYNGDLNFAPSKSTTVKQVVDK